MPRLSTPLMPRRFLALSVPALLVSSLMAACGSATPGSSTSTPMTAPAPIPIPTTATAPLPGSTLPSSCRALPPAAGAATGCRQEPPDFLGAVAAAVSVAQNATIVDPDSMETYALVQNGLIQSPNAYLKTIADTLDGQGLCAVYDGEELNVRNSSGYNELFDIITSNGGSWVKYMSTCTPAMPLPVIAPPPALDPECRLPPSRETYCDRPDSAYGGDVIGALDELIARDRLLAQPLIFDFSDRLGGQAEGWKVTNVPLYFSELRRGLRSRGYCSLYVGDDELFIKKGTNRISEHWDLLKAEGYSLRLFAAACHDAAF